MQTEITLAREDVGAGQTIVLLHGHPLNRKMWRAQIDALKSDYRVIAPDLRGYGETPAAGDTATISQMANDVAVLLDKLEIEQIVLGGLSMGGYIAFEFVKQFPERVRALILANTKPGADDEAADKKRFETADKAVETGMQPIVDEMLPRVLAAETLEAQAETVEFVREMMLSTEPAGAAAGMRGMAERADNTDTLSNINIPTLIIVGEEDKVTTPDDAEAMHRAIKNSQLVRITDAAHLTPIEQPAAFNRALTGFLAALT